MKKEPTSKSKVLNYSVVVFVIIILVATAFGPTGGPGAAYQKSVLQTTRAIELSLDAYSKDHSGHYPEGKSSTEIFQHLIDGKYVTDPSIFYVHLFHVIGKVPPKDESLKRENVCFDVTCCVDSSAPGGLPAVFLTGYRITYQPGSSAVPLPLPYSPPFSKTWSEWVYGVPYYKRPFIAVAYKNGSANWTLADEDGSIPNFIPTDFDPKGKTYRQLTP